MQTQTKLFKLFYLFYIREELRELASREESGKGNELLQQLRRGELVEQVDTGQNNTALCCTVL